MKFWVLKFHRPISMIVYLSPVDAPMVLSLGKREGCSALLLERSERKFEIAYSFQKRFA